VFAYAWILDLLAQDQVDAARQQLEVVMANFAYLLVNERFWQYWVARRREVYQVPIEEEHIAQIISHIEGHISDIITHRFGQYDHGSVSPQSQQLVLAWERELEAARTLRKTADFTQDFGTGQEAIGFGPLFMRCRRLEKEVKHVLLVENAPRLKRLFSELGLCEVLVSRGQLHEALRLLEEKIGAVEGESSLLSARELAYMRHEMISQVQAQIAENMVRDRIPDLAAAAAYWQKALQSSTTWDGVEQMRRQVTQTALGRAQALRKRQLDQAIALLECVYEVLQDGHIAGQLAELLRERAVTKANKILKDGKLEALEACIPDLRRALALNPHINQTRLDLCQTLSIYADWRYQHGEILQAAEALQEIIRLASDEPSTHRNDKQLQELVQQSHWRLSILQGSSRSQERSTGELLDVLRNMLESAPSEQTLSATRHNQDGVQKMRQGDYEGATGDFIKALELEPSFEIAKENLKRVVIRHTAQLIKQGDRQRAAEVLQDFKQHFPNL
jgi:tetratricopeptide (TPR) repeat protein